MTRAERPPLFHVKYNLKYNFELETRNLKLETWKTISYSA